MTVAVTVSAGFGQGALAVLGLFPLLAIVWYSAFIMESDLVIDDTGISKVFKGKTLQSLDWENIKSFKNLTIVAPGGKVSRFFHVHPIKKSKIHILSGGRVVFSSRMYNFEEFVKLINGYIKFYRIRVDVVNNGECISRNEIFVYNLI
ncbi:hypothetical protein [Rhodanobacter hydrolyticus]|uniref:Uncharacterized protein n=1 Tax=Rhodanobacter hydrolyticus TaxID=2250595 RepID=A0ABW8J0U6_9GAMM